MGSVQPTSAKVSPPVSGESGLTPDRFTEDQQYIAHIVQSGEDIRSFAETKYGVHWSTLKRENGELVGRESKVYAGQLVYIPRFVYDVRYGDTLPSVARKLNVDVNDLRDTNRRPTDDDLLLPGEQLVVPPKRTQYQAPPLSQPMAPLSSNTMTRPLTPLPMEPSVNSGVSLLNPNPISRSPGMSALPRPPVSAVPPQSVAPTPVGPPDGSPEPIVTPMPQPAPLDVTGLTAASFGTQLNPFTGRVLQRMLNRTGADLAVDGDVGSGTRAALATFQKQSGLIGQKGVKPGIVDSATLAALSRAAAAPAELKGVDVEVTDRDLQEPDIRAAFGFVSALAHDDPTRFRALLQMDRAKAKDGSLIIDRTTLQAIADHVHAHGFRLKKDPTWTYNEAQSVADMISNSLGVDRVWKNWTYDGLITASVGDEMRKYMIAHPDYVMRPGLDMPALIKAINSAETSFNPGVVSTANAGGMMQFMRGTAREVGLKDRFNVEQSYRAAVRYILDYAPRYADRSDAEFIAYLASAYNFGPNGTVHDLPRNHETDEYRGIVEKLYNFYKGVAEPRADAPMPPASALGSRRIYEGRRPRSRRLTSRHAVRHSGRR